MPVGFCMRRHSPPGKSLAYVGFEVLSPFVAYGVEGALRYSDPSAINQRLAGIADNLGADLAALDSRPIIRFNQMSEWGANGRIKPDAPVYSPYIRRRKKLELE